MNIMKNFIIAVIILMIASGCGKHEEEADKLGNEASDLISQQKFYEAYQKAQEGLDKGYGNDRQKGAFMGVKAIYYETSGATDSAIVEYKKSIETYDKNGRIFIFYGGCLFSTGKIEEGIKKVKLGIEKLEEEKTQSTLNKRKAASIEEDDNAIKEATTLLSMMTQIITVKNGILFNYKWETIGQAFDTYCEGKANWVDVKNELNQKNTLFIGVIPKGKYKGEELRALFLLNMDNSIELQGIIIRPSEDTKHKYLLDSNGFIKEANIDISDIYYQRYQ